MPTPTYNVPFPFVLPPATLRVADRLIATLMTLVRAVAHIANGNANVTGTPTCPDHAAKTLLFRLSALVTTLIRISNGALPTPKPTPADTQDDTQDAPPPTALVRPLRPQPLPRRPGWLLAALPGIAPAIAADLAALLADPALAALLATAPGVDRTLRPLLRALGLATPPPPPSPGAPPPHPHPPPPPNHPPHPNPSHHLRKPRTISKPALPPIPLHVYFITQS